MNACARRVRPTVLVAFAVGGKGPYVRFSWNVNVFLNHKMVKHAFLCVNKGR